MSTNLIWIDENLDIEENQDYAKELNSFLSLHAKFFKNLEQAFEHLKNIKFQETKVILSGKLYAKFIQKFKENIKDICVSPKFIIFTRDKKKFSDYNPNYKNDQFYNSGGVAVTIEEVKKFLESGSKLKKSNNEEVIELSNEYLSSSFGLIY